MKIASKRLKEIIKEEMNEWDAAQMSSPEQRDRGEGLPSDAARMLSGILDDWMNEPSMNGTPMDDYFDRVEEVMVMLKEHSTPGEGSQL